MPLMYSRPPMLCITISIRRVCPLFRPVVVRSTTVSGRESASWTLSSSGWVAAMGLVIRLRRESLLSRLFKRGDDVHPAGHQATAFLGEALGDIYRNQAGDQQDARDHVDDRPLVGQPQVI